MPHDYVARARLVMEVSAARVRWEQARQRYRDEPSATAKAAIDAARVVLDKAEEALAARSGPDS
jgi:hypothetical protein